MSILFFLCENEDGPDQKRRDKSKKTGRIKKDGTDQKKTGRIKERDRTKQMINEKGQIRGDLSFVQRGTYEKSQNVRIDLHKSEVHHSNVVMRVL